MVEKPGFYAIEALNPYTDSGEPPINLYLSKVQAVGAADKALTARFARIKLIPGLVKKPTMVLEGWKRDGYDKALIYVGSPKNDWRTPAIETPRPPGMLFLVFATPGSYTISDWRWEKESETDPGMPEQSAERSEKILWPTNQKT